MGVDDLFNPEVTLHRSKLNRTMKVNKPKKLTELPKSGGGIKDLEKIKCPYMNIELELINKVKPISPMVESANMKQFMELIIDNSIVSIGICITAYHYYTCVTPYYCVVSNQIKITKGSSCGS